MINTQQELLETFATLPPEAQQQTFDFITLLHHTYKQDRAQSKPKIDWANESVIGIWKHREDIRDSTKWVRNLRSMEC